MYNISAIVCYLHSDYTAIILMLELLYNIPISELVNLNVSKNSIFMFEP